MIDYGLLMSMIVGFGVPSLLVHWWPLSSYKGPVGFLDVALGPAFAGLAVGRLVALALDDPSSIGSVSDMLIIRSGVEFWAGVVAAAGLVAWSARRDGLSPFTRLADLAPLAMIGYASYEAACVFRDGCFGPDSAIGLRPPGLSTTMLPIGLFMAAAVVVAAFGVRRLSRRGVQPSIVVLCAAVSVATVRAIGSIWLPHVGDGLTRQHLTSIGVVLLSAAGLVGVLVATQQRSADRTRVSGS
ncbi:MAG: hypothetical protein ACC652_01420 [Acidimicrobiales bacterium]